MLGLLGPNEWASHAACLNHQQPDIFFPGEHGDYSEARKVCATCPVAEQCLQEALNRREEFGVWGGLSTNERKQLINATEATK